jgi:hypothetical protein
MKDLSIDGYPVHELCGGQVAIGPYTFDRKGNIIDVEEDCRKRYTPGEDITNFEIIGTLLKDMEERGMTLYKKYLELKSKSSNRKKNKWRAMNWERDEI